MWKNVSYNLSRFYQKGDIKNYFCTYRFKLYQIQNGLMKIQFKTDITILHLK